MSEWAAKIEARLAAMARQIELLSTSQPTIYPAPARLKDEEISDRIDRVCTEVVTVPLNVFAPPSAAEAFPVGSVYISTLSTNPGTTLGYGTWSAVATGQVLVGYQAGDPDFGTLGASVGAKTVASAGTLGFSTINTADVAITGASNRPEANHTHIYTGDLTSVIQPSFVVTIWERTA